MATSCQSEPGPGALQIHVRPSARHLEHADWRSSTDKQARITPFVDDSTNRYVEDEARLPAVAGPLDPTDCIVFRNIDSGWWEIRATAQPPRSDCSWYGGSGKMIFVDESEPQSTDFQPTLACA